MVPSLLLSWISAALGYGFVDALWQAFSSLTPTTVGLHWWSVHSRVVSILLLRPGRQTAYSRQSYIMHQRNLASNRPAFLMVYTYSSEWPHTQTGYITPSAHFPALLLRTTAVNTLRTCLSFLVSPVSIHPVQLPRQQLRTQYRPSDNRGGSNLF